jgi:serine/threonine-protein kinase
MLTGRPLFAGEDVSSTLARVLEREPDFSVLPQNLHPRIRLLLERCLKKEPQNRYSGISDARVDVQEVMADPSGVFTPPVMLKEDPTGVRSVLPWILAVLSIVIVGLVVWYWRTPEPRRVEIEYVLPEDQQLKIGPSDSAQIAISPDGKQFVYATTKGLYLRSVDRLDNRHISGSEDDSLAPFFSPDSQWIGYHSAADRKLKKIAVSGGEPVPLCDIETNLAGAQWRPDDTIVFSLYPNSRIMQIPANGGTPEPLFKTESLESSGAPIFPQILPNGENVLFTNPYVLQIMIQSLKTGEKKQLLGGNWAYYLPTKHILYSSSEIDGNSVYAVAFDVDRLEAKREAVRLLGKVNSISVSDSGTIAYVPQPETALQSDTQGRTLWWVDRDGNEELIPAPPNMYRHPRISPDGTKVALAVQIEGNTDIRIWDLVEETLTRLTFDKADDMSPIWSPNGERIFFISLRDGPMGIYSKASDNTGKVERICFDPDLNLMPWSISGDGKTLLIAEMSTDFSNIAIGRLSLEGTGARERLLEEGSLASEPQISPDGRWMAYFSTVTNNWEIYVRPFPDVASGGPWQVSTGGGDAPRWSPDGRELFYITSNGDAVMSVPVETEPTFNLGKSRLLFRGTFVAGYQETISYDIHPDDGRFLMIKPPKSAGIESTVEDPRKIIIITNWFEELKERVPVD